MKIYLILYSHCRNADNTSCATQGVDWGAMGSSGSNKLLLNYYRGYNTLCFKERCVINIQTYCKRKGTDYKSFMPVALVIKCESFRVTFVVAIALVLNHSIIITAITITIRVSFGVSVFSVIYSRSHTCLCLVATRCMQGVWTEKLWWDFRACSNSARNHASPGHADCCIQEGCWWRLGLEKRLDSQARSTAGLFGRFACISDVDFWWEWGPVSPFLRYHQTVRDWNWDPRQARQAVGLLRQPKGHRLTDMFNLCFMYCNCKLVPIHASPAVGAIVRCVQGKGHPFVVQKYIERPLLCKGGRKFDIRLWVLLSNDYKIGLSSSLIWFSFVHSYFLLRWNNCGFDHVQVFTPRVCCVPRQ